MRVSLLATAIAVALGSAANATAATIEERLAAMEQRLNYLEQRVRIQDRVIEARNEEIAKLRGDNSGGGGDGWFNKVKIGGLIEIEAGQTSTDGDDDSDLVTGTVELGIAAAVNDWVDAEIVLLYEEDTDNANEDGTGDISVDTAMVSIADPDAAWFVNAGQFTLPFGQYPTSMVSDPLTLDLGETGDTALEAGYNFGPVTASAYVFDGDQNSSAIKRFGLALSTGIEANGVGIAGHLGYLSDLGETDGLNDFGDNQEDVPGWIASAEISAGDFVLIAEYLATTDSFASAPGEEPTAFNVELGYNFALAGAPSVFAVSHQETDDMGTLDPGFVEKRNGAALTAEVMEGTSLALEYLTEEAYDGTDSDTITGKLAVEF